VNGEAVVGEGSTAILVTFLLAFLGYAGMTAVVWVMSTRGLPVLLWRIVSAVILCHSVMIWAFRYHWQLDLAVRKGYAGFLMFHGAVVLVIAANFAPERIARRLIEISFLVITAGSIGATFLYEAAGAYRYPVLACAAAGLWCLGRRRIRRA